MFELGGIHRKPQVRKYARTDEAREHDRYFIRTYAIIKWCLTKKPHMIFLIENPRGALRHMPIMKCLENGEGLPYGHQAYRAEVNYCAFGRVDMKPTDIWTNVSCAHYLAFGVLGEQTLTVFCFFRI